MMKDPGNMVVHRSLFFYPGKCKLESKLHYIWKNTRLLLFGINFGGIKPLSNMF